VFSLPDPPRYYNRSSGVEWPESVTAGLKDLNAEIARLREKRENYLRDQAYALGLASLDLADLRSERGHGFIELVDRHHSFRRAKEDVDAPYDEEWAYWCGYAGLFGAGKESVGCGWVRGWVRSESYDDIGMLSGSAGERHYCQLCGAEIGETRTMVS
jgi:hypothetical protein